LSERPGPLVYVMGPSGAGKDSVLNLARERLAPTTPVVFAHRYITRAAEAAGENHIALSHAEFALRRSNNLFAFHWRAHGNEYGIGCEVRAWREAGLGVVVSGSRQHFLAMGGIDRDTHPVLITAPPERLAERLAARSREDSGAVAARLDRSEAYPVNDPRLMTIVNDGELSDAAEAFISLLARLVCSRDARHRA